MRFVVRCWGEVTVYGDSACDVEGLVGVRGAEMGLLLGVLPVVFGFPGSDSVL